MAQRHFLAGEILFSTGDPARFAYVIEEGSVARRSVDADGTPVEHIDEPGAVIGAAALIDGAYHGTATALTEVKARAIDRERFLATLRAMDTTAEAEVIAMLERLGILRALAVADATQAPDAPVTRWSALTLTAETPMGREVPAAGINIMAVPFSVGRQPLRGEVMPRGAADLLLTDRRPFSLSRLHFAIERAPDGLAVRDLGSNLGTRVNGTRIGEDAAHNMAPVRAGANEIVAGGVESPFRFTLTVATDG